ncbi:MAG: glycosyltransferase [Paludibacterium sp.]|uniref:glycosyltransferase family 2 protein n=1 Tax=Paludibacterium sp. TaxID=1917523 RepID=UPI0025F65C0A|nr:glycosyltransferase family 2 protein [Paludibacterium sp.]MBV8047725.1 glycosyltransferase [Paludibacterium sp.]MBV8648306.1 glycosyltransferase [Paludibacterium sp.]
MLPIVSIILPSYNDLSYLETTLRSITAQTFTNFELIIVDDGSSDETPVRLRSLIAADTRLRYARRERGGVGAARNTGLAQARGRFVAFVDADDLLHPAFLHTLVNAAENAGADVAQCHMHPFADGTPCNFPPTYTVAGKGMSGPDALRGLLAGDLPASVVCRLYRRERLGELRFAEGLIYEDLEFSVRLMAQATKVQIVPLALYGCRRRQRGLRAQYAPSLVEDRITVTQHIKDTLQQHGLWPAERTVFQQLAARFLGREGFKDLIRDQSLDEFLYQRLLASLKTDGELTFSTLRKLPIDAGQKKWVGLPLISPALGRHFLNFQLRRRQKRVRA